MKYFLILLLLSIGFANEYWIFFRDKGPSKDVYSSEYAEQFLTDRAIEKRYAMGREPGFIDVPVYRPYIDSLENLGLTALVEAKWINAYCFRVEDISVLDNIDFITRIRKTATFRRDPVPQPDEQYHFNDLQIQSVATDRFDYGVTYTQMKTPGIIDMHNHGYFGDGIRIGVFDSGFKTDHPAFDSMTIIAEYDFIHDTAYVGNSPEDVPGQHDHGTRVLSVIGGVLPGRYRGGAFNAEFLLAKTEDIRSETQQEEYNWVDAVNWAFEYDVDIITSSLGYYDWYTFDSLDGDKAVITQIADIAAQLGVLVVTSAGNARRGFGHITPPADGDSVLAVGAVTPAGDYAWFSSPGPTFDGRIKPDVCELGTNVWVVVTQDETGMNFAPGAGTSFSCPIVTSAAALVMQAKREMGEPVFGWDLGLLLKETADMHCNPDNDYGWGRPIAPVAAGLSYEDDIYRAMSFSLMDSLGERIQGLIRLSYGDTFFVYNTDARGVLTLYPLKMGDYAVDIEVDGYPTIQDTISLSSQYLNLCRLVDMADSPAPEPGSDFKVFPVPARDTITISRLRVQNRQEMTVMLFDASGNPCFSETVIMEPFQRAHSFDLKTGAGEGLASGIYYLIISLSEDKETIVQEKRTIIIAND